MALDKAKWNVRSVRALMDERVDDAFQRAALRVKLGEIAPTFFMSARDNDAADDAERVPYKTTGEITFLDRVELVGSELVKIAIDLTQYGLGTNVWASNFQPYARELVIRYFEREPASTQTIQPANDIQRMCVTLFADALVLADRKARAGYYAAYRSDDTADVAKGLATLNSGRRVDVIAEELVRMVEAVKGGFGERPVDIVGNVEFAHRYVRLRGSTI